MRRDAPDEVDVWHALGDVRPSVARGFWCAFSLLWLASATTGIYVVWAYDTRPGQAAEARPGWPADPLLARDRSRPTLVMLAHPQCSCTRTSLAELAEVLARTASKPKTFVVFLRPRGFADPRSLYAAPAMTPYRATA